MIIIECEQRSPEWFMAKLGVPSAGSFDKIVTTKGEPSKQARQYIYQLAGEYVSGQHMETYSSFAMERGTALEDEARNLYEFQNGVEVQQIGFCRNELAGCSPDGLVGDDGGLEIKCPLIHTHVEYLLTRKLPSAYFQQVQGSLYVTGRKWWDFMSYYPGLKPLLIRATPDIEFMVKLEAALREFNRELEETIQAIS
jgi:hypothetical protein